MIILGLGFEINYSGLTLFYKKKRLNINTPFNINKYHKYGISIDSIDTTISFRKTKYRFTHPWEKLTEISREYYPCQYGIPNWSSEKPIDNKIMYMFKMNILNIVTYSERNMILPTFHFFKVENNNGDIINVQGTPEKRVYQKGDKILRHIFKYIFRERVDTAWLFADSDGCFTCVLLNHDILNKNAEDVYIDYNKGRYKLISK
jgi:hypothetical protein